MTEEFQLDPVGGFDVVQDVELGVPKPPDDAGHIVRMKADIVEKTGPDTFEPIPITELMLHHIVFINAGRLDQSCDEVLPFDNLQSQPVRERFFAAGEERAKMVLPSGYGYSLEDGPAWGGEDPWGVLYMVMNHRPEANTNAYVQYEMTIDDDPEIESVTPWWLDANNCKADPIYNVKGDDEEGSEHVRTRDFPLQPDRFGPTGGRVVAAGGHVHGGAHRLELSQPACGDRTFFESEPTWGFADHPFYTVRPILHEPGPINMSAFTSETGFPVESGESLRLRAAYDGSQPHTRVMGIMIAYVAPDAAITDSCAEPLPTDLEVLGSNEPGREDPVPFEVPLVAEDPDAPGGWVELRKPPGKLKRVESGTKVEVTGANEFLEPNLKIDVGDKLEWEFSNSRTNLHNLTLANGPEAIGSPNLSEDEAGNPRSFKRKFKTPGQYRMFCALHPTLMHERVVVKR